MRTLRLAQSLNTINSGIGVNNDFVFIVRTANVGVSSENQFQLPLVSAGDIDISVDWGDGSITRIESYNQAETLHTYSSPGDYQVKITNEVVGWRFVNSGDKLKLIKIENWGNFNFTASGAFWGCSNLNSSATDPPIISTTNMSFSFRSCSSFNGELNMFNVSSVTNISNMLRGASSFDKPLNLWNINKVTNMANFLTGGSISTVNYNELLIGWVSTVPQNNLVVDFGSSTYTAAPEPGGQAHDSLTSATPGGYGWTITDGGTA